MTYDGRMGPLGSHSPDGGDEPNTNSTLPIQMYPSHGNSSHAHSAMMSAPLIHVDLSDVITLHRLCEEIQSFVIVPKTPDSHPQA